MTTTPTYRIRPLVWEGFEAVTPFGYYRIWEDGGTFGVGVGDCGGSEVIARGVTLSVAMDTAQKHWAAQLAQVLEVVELTQCTDRAHAHFQSRLGECFSALEAIMRLPSDAPINRARAIAQRSLGYSDATVAGIEKAKGDQ